MERRVLLGLLSAVFFGLVVGCILQESRENPGQSCTRQIFAMDTFMSFTAYGKNSEEAVAAAVIFERAMDVYETTEGIGRQLESETGFTVVNRE